MPDKVHSRKSPWIYISHISLDLKEAKMICSAISAQGFTALLSLDVQELSKPKLIPGQRIPKVDNREKSSIEYIADAHCAIIICTPARHAETLIVGEDSELVWLLETGRHSYYPGAYGSMRFTHRDNRRISSRYI
jgi:hypothetical protein